MSTNQRHQGREAAVQLLYQLETTRSYRELEQAIASFFELYHPQLVQEARQFTELLCRGVSEKLDEIDKLLSQASTHWRTSRMCRVDLSILRLATFELTQSAGPPPRVVINEAVELGKAYGSSESSAFINGVLNRLAKDLDLEV